MKLIPLADNVLVKSTLEEETTSSGIILATATKDRPAIYDVMAVGPKCAEISVGDKVVVNRETGTDVKLDGADYKFVKMEEILAVVTD